MPWFKRQDDTSRQAEKDALARQQQSIDLLARGELPLTARERLARQRESGGTWSSDLSVDELLAIRSVGFEPAGQVLGASVYHVGRRQRCSGTTQFLNAYTDAVYAARRQALSRMRQEATGLGGQGVVGVRLTMRTIGEPGESSLTLEFTALGTAIRHSTAQPLPQPFTSDMSGQEFAKLMQAGYIPTDLVMGVSALHLHTGWRTRWQQSWGTQEVEMYTQAMVNARNEVINRLQQHLAEAGADGVIGSTVNFEVAVVECARQEGLEDHLLEFFAVGTAITRFGEATPNRPAMAKRLDDRRPAAAAT
jgi:uncharacterized protein YbjQ (UPF0145 family)